LTVATGPTKPDKPGETPSADSGSIDVQLSGPSLPATKSGSIEVSTGEPSGSVDVQFSVPVAVPHADSQPVSSGRVRSTVPTDVNTPSKGLRAVAADVVGEGVSKLGSGVEKIGEGVTKLGDMTKKVPFVGSSVTAIGEGVTSVGEVLHQLPIVARTRRGRLLVRSMFVAFFLVFTWIAAIVMVQLNRNDSPDFRPDAEHILATISSGRDGIDKTYDNSSPRFQEMVRKERFVDDMTDMNKTLGKFHEITAINDTLFTTGPTGKIGRVSITAAFDKATCRAAVNFHLDQGAWKLFGIQVELPPELLISQAEREERVQACRDTSSAKACEIRAVSEHILEQLRDGKAGDVYDAATDVFKKQEERANFVKIQTEQRDELGPYKRIVAVTEAKVIGGTSATFDVLVEHDKTNAVRTVFGLSRRSKTEPWQLRLYKVVMPVPRAADDKAASKTPVPPPPLVQPPHDAGTK